MGQAPEGAALPKVKRGRGRPSATGWRYLHISKGRLYGVRVPGRPRQSLGIVTRLQVNSPEFKRQFPDFPHRFHATVAALLGGCTVASGQQSQSPRRGSVAELIDAFRHSNDFRRVKQRGKVRSSRTLGDKALSERARYLDIIREIAGPLPVDRAKTKDLQDLVMGRWGADAESGKDAAPTAQKKAVGVLEVLFDFGLAQGLLAKNPASGLLRDEIPDSAGRPIWEEDAHCLPFERVTAEDSPERLAYALAKFVCTRKGDLIRLTWQDLRTVTNPATGERVEAFVFTPSKTAHERNPVTVTSPLHPELERILRHHRRESVAQVGPLLLRPDGRQHDEQSFGRWFRKACDKAGLPEQYGVHGLRKTATCALIARGVSDRDIMAILGWKSPDQIKVYGDRYNRVISAIRAHKTWTAAWVTEAAA